MISYSDQQEFVNSTKNFRYIIGNRRCGKTITTIKAVCKFVSEGKPGAIICPESHVSRIQNLIIEQLSLETKTDSSTKKMIIRKDSSSQNIKTINFATIWFFLPNAPLSGIRADWIWVERVWDYEWNIWNEVIPRLNNYPVGGVLLLTENKSLLSNLINSEEYNMILMDWKELRKFWEGKG
jgi:hypothetical protein